jgi:hypothetical protein
MKRAAGAALEGLHQRGWGIKIGETLGEIDRLMFVGEPGHLADDRLVKNVETRGSCGHVKRDWKKDDE